MAALNIDLASIDRHSFKVNTVGGEVMIQPHRTKLRWSDEELPWRSLVTDPSGRVLSAAWPKFFNYGENAAHDADFVRALAAGEVTFVEKLDGTLLVADARRGGPRLRTRGPCERLAPLQSLPRPMSLTASRDSGRRLK